MKQRRKIILFSLFLMMCTSFVFAINIIPIANATVLKQYPSDDAFVDSTTPTTNYGSAVSLFTIAMGGLPPTIVKESYLKFTVSKFLNAPVVKLYFTTGHIETGYTIKIAFCISTTDWTEASVTWNTKPSIPNPFDEIAVLWISESFTQYSINIKNYISGDVISIATSPYYAANETGLVTICSKECNTTAWEPYISDDGTTPVTSSLPWIIGLIITTGIIGCIIYFKREKKIKKTIKVKKK